MSCKISNEILRNRQVNYLIIEKLWEHHNKGKGKDEFYEMIGIDKNAYTRIRTADTYTFYPNAFLNQHNYRYLPFLF